MYVVIEIKQWSKRNTEVIISELIPTYQEATKLADQLIKKLGCIDCVIKILIVQAENMEDVKRWITVRSLLLKQDGELYYYQNKLSSIS